MVSNWALMEHRSRPASMECHMWIPCGWLKARIMECSILIKSVFIQGHSEWLLSTCFLVMLLFACRICLAVRCPSLLHLSPSRRPLGITRLVSTYLSVQCQARFSRELYQGSTSWSYSSRCPEVVSANWLLRLTDPDLWIWCNTSETMFPQFKRTSIQANFLRLGSNIIHHIVSRVNIILQWVLGLSPM